MRIIGPMPIAAKISTTAIDADAITNAKITDDALDSEHYTDGSIDSAHLADDAVTGDKIDDGMNPSVSSTGKALVLGF